jgi:putative transposase
MSRAPSRCSATPRTYNAKRGQAPFCILWLLIPFVTVQVIHLDLLVMLAYTRSVMRQPRLQAPGALHHVFARGNNKQSIFRDDSDREYFLNLLSSVVSDFSWVCHSYCVMDNHYHLLLETPEGGLPEGMQVINGYFSSRFNRKYGNVGHVLQGRYHSPLIKHESHFLELLRYMALNPVKDGFVKHPKDWRWSCFRALAGIEPCPGFLTFSLALGIFASDMDSARALYSAFVLDRLQEALEASRGRPGLAELFVTCQNRNQRNAAITKAYTKHRYSMTEIASYLHVDCSTVCRVISRLDSDTADWDFRI